MTPWLTHVAAGLTPHQCYEREAEGTTPGVCVQVRPLLDRVAAVLPVLHGQVTISIDARNGTHSIGWPTGVTITAVSLPLAITCGAVESAEVEVGEGDGSVAVGFSVVSAPWQRGQGLFESYAEIDISSAREIFNGSSARHLMFRVRCHPKMSARQDAENVLSTASPVYGAPSWDVPMVASDARTQGAWVGRYGVRGHMLFGLDGVSGSLNLTAPYIVGVAWPSGGGKESNASTGSLSNVSATDPKHAAALQLPTGAQPLPRAIGFLTTNSIEPMAIEVTLRPQLMPARADGSRCLNVSLYFVDWTGENAPVEGVGSRVHRQSAVDVFTVAPDLEIDVGYATAVVSHPQLADGEYRTWRACRDKLKTNATGFAVVRFRVYIVTGFNATVSGVFFD